MDKWPCRVMGIDPGLRLTGYGVVSLAKGAIEPTLVEGGVIKLDGKQSMESRLLTLSNDLNALIDELKPDRLVVEQLYSHYAHPRTAILMGHARGVILLCGQRAGIEIDHLAATEIKKAVSGNGHATKRQMQLSVQAQCGLAEPPSPPDVADAIAIALCAARRLVGR